MDNEKWQKFFQSNVKANLKRVFVKVMTSDNKHWFFSDYDVWYEVKKHCEENSLFIKDLHLQFRSHKCIMNLDDDDGIYLVRSVLGGFGIETKQYMTVGVLKDGLVHKQMWLCPELIKEKEFEDPLDLCFEEALITYEQEKKTNRKE